VSVAASLRLGAGTDVEEIAGPATFQEDLLIDLETFKCALKTCIERFLAQSPTTDAKGAVATSLLETLTDISVSAQRLLFPPRRAGPDTMGDVAIFEHIEATVTKHARKRKAKAKQIQC